MNRRELFKAAALLPGISIPYFWIPNASARSEGRVRDQLIEAQHGTFVETNMNRLLARAAEAQNIQTGASAQIIRAVDREVRDSFPDASRSEVWGASYSALFWRYSSDELNACSAWFYENRRVTRMEGPILVSLYGCMLDMTKYSTDRQYILFNARELTRGFCAPMEANLSRFVGTFYTVNAAPDIFNARDTIVKIEYSRLSTTSYQGESRYTVWDRVNNTVVYSGSRKFWLLS